MTRVKYLLWTTQTSMICQVYVDKCELWRHFTYKYNIYSTYVIQSVLVLFDKLRLVLSFKKIQYLSRQKFAQHFPKCNAYTLECIVMKKLYSSTHFLISWMSNIFCLFTSYSIFSTILFLIRKLKLIINWLLTYQCSSIIYTLYNMFYQKLVVICCPWFYVK